jgi:hypothetical protein
MAVTSAQVSVTQGAAVALNAADTDSVGGVVLLIRNTDATATNTAIPGASGVAAGTGYRLAGGSTPGPLAVPSGKTLFAIAGTVNTVVVDVLRLGA